MSSVLPRWNGRRKKAERLAILFTAALIASVFVLLGCASSVAGRPRGAGDRAAADRAGSATQTQTPAPPRAAGGLR